MPCPPESTLLSHQGFGLKFQGMVEGQNTSPGKPCPQRAPLLALSLDPLEEGLLVKQHSSASAFDHAIKTVRFCVEDQMAEATLGGPCVVVIPFGYRDQAVIYCRRVISFLHTKSPVFV